ncbi:MAG: hypothetical protein ACPG6B_06175 [Oceanihabitans sp.]
MKKIKSHLPEIYFILAILYYWSLTGLIINWFAIGLLVLVGILIISKNSPLGIVLGSLLILINIYMFFALASEFSEFKTFNTKARDLLVFGVLFLGSNLIFSILLLYKYATVSNKKTA